MDTLLTELASKCAFSASAIRCKTSKQNTGDASSSGSRARILRRLYLPLSPAEADVVTQIILKDLRPLLYPLPGEAAHYRAALMDFNSRSVAPLTKEGAMHAWDPSGRMLALYGVRASLDDASDSYENIPHGEGRNDESFLPQVGLPIMVYFLR